MRKKNGSLSSKLRSERGLVKSKDDYFYYIFETTRPFATKLSVIVQYHKPECPVKNGFTALKVKVTAKVKNVSECLPRGYLLNQRTFCRQTWYDYAAS